MVVLAASIVSKTGKGANQWVVCRKRAQILLLKGYACEEQQIQGASRTD